MVRDAFVTPVCIAGSLNTPTGGGNGLVMCGAVFTLRRRLFVAALGIVLAGGICAALLVTRGPAQGPASAGQRTVIPHLVPDTGGLHAGSQGTSSAPRPRLLITLDSN